MGCTTSTPVRDAPLCPQPKPVVAFGARFCEREFLTLEKLDERDILWREVTAFRDVRTGDTRFRINRWLLSRRRSLYDRNNAPVANFKGRFCLNTSTTYVRDGDDFEGNTVLKIRATYDHGEKSVVRVKFNDAVTSERYELGFVGDWRARDGLLWLERRHCGVREPVARVHRPSRFAHAHSFELTIAPNMDSAVVVLICGILGTKQRRAERIERYEQKRLDQVARQQQLNS